MLNIKAGTILGEDDKHYKSFAGWAERKDTRNGAIIAEFICVKDENDIGNLSKSELVDLIAEFNGANPEFEIKYKGNASKSKLVELLQSAQDSLIEPTDPED